MNFDNLEHLTNEEVLSLFEDVVSLAGTCHCKRKEGSSAPANVYDPGNVCWLTDYYTTNYTDCKNHCEAIGHVVSGLWYYNWDVSHIAHVHGHCELGTRTHSCACFRTGTHTWSGVYDPTRACWLNDVQSFEFCDYSCYLAGHRGGWHFDGLVSDAHKRRDHGYCHIWR